ncbi:hypothetical protein T492DRAFT_833283 [Pavlovales sp. CCMP2436]|nr:hypothetical protein T492DRAFT_833283 [Pavlovales sp. CCMP2436]
MWVSYIRIDPNVERQMVLDRGGIIMVPCNDFVQTSTSVAAGSNHVSMPIAVRAKSATAIFVAIRKTANLGALGVFNLDRFTGGDTVGNVSYRFRIGSTIIPSSYVTAGAESRMELMRALGMQLSESTARTCVSAADYLNTAFVIGVSLQCFPMTEALGDGLLVDSTIILEINLESDDKHFIWIGDRILVRSVKFYDETYRHFYVLRTHLSSPPEWRWVTLSVVTLPSIRVHAGLFLPPTKPWVFETWAHKQTQTNSISAQGVIQYRRCRMVDSAKRWFQLEIRRPHPTSYRVQSELHWA